MTRNLPKPGMARWLSGLLASALLVAAMSGLLVLLKIPDLQDSIATFAASCPVSLLALVNAEMTGQHPLRRRLPSSVGPNAAQAPP